MTALRKFNEIHARKARATWRKKWKLGKPCSSFARLRDWIDIMTEEWSLADCKDKLTKNEDIAVKDTAIIELNAADLQILRKP